MSIGDERFLKELVYCHKKIFPYSIQNIFGDRYLMMSFYWFMLNHKKRGLLIYEQGGRIIGYLTMRFSDDMDSFLIYIYKTVIRCFITRPALILNYLLIKKMLNYFKPNKYLRTKKKYIELVSIGVLPSYLNKGIGKELLKEFDEYAKINKIDLCILYILKANKKTARFYLSNGWLKTPNDFGDYSLYEKNNL